MTKLLAQIPFSGFYESIHNYLIEQAIEGYWPYDENTGEPICPDNFWETFSYKKDVWEKYAKLYTDKLSEYASNEQGFAVDLEFESLSSPKCYNFETDRIFAYIPLCNIEALFENVKYSDQPDSKWQEHVNDQCKSRSGFASFYNAFCDGWKTKALKEWDHNELHVLLSFVMDYDQLDIMETARCNGYIDNIVNESYTEWEANQRQAA